MFGVLKSFFTAAPAHAVRPFSISPKEVPPLERYYNIAGIVFRVTGHEEDFSPEEGPLAPFRVPPCPWDHTLEIEAVSGLPAPAGSQLYADPGKRVYQEGAARVRYVGAVAQGAGHAYLRIARRGAASRVLLRRDYAGPGAPIGPRVILNSLEAEHHIAARGGFLLHASYIRHNGRAILFTAPSGTGKSTQAALWESLRGAEVLNGDRAAVMPGGFVHGLPFSGSSGISKNVTSPLAAIVCLSQAPETAITPLSGLRAFRQVWEGCSVNIWDRGDVDACSRAVLDTVSAVPVFHLACTPDESAVSALENALKGCESHGKTTV